MTDKDINSVNTGAEDTADTQNESSIFTAPEVPKESYDSRRKANILKRQTRLIAILAIVVAVAVCAYFFVVVPIVNYVEEISETEQIELLEGEVLGTNNQILMFEHCQATDIQTIEVSNDNGGYGFYYDSEQDDFFMIDNMSAPYNSSRFASLVSSAGYALTTERVTTDCENLAEFGLTEDQTPAQYTITTRKGASHTVYVGDATADGSGYYVRYKDRDAVYIVGYSIGTTVFNSLEDMITPILTLPMAENDYFTIKNFSIIKDGEVVVLISYLDEEERADLIYSTAYNMLYPANYQVNTISYPDVLEVITNFQGSKTLSYAPTEEDREKYGLINPKYSVYYEYQGIKQLAVFSEKNENGNYYAYSALFDLITEVSGDKMEWLDWDVIKWVDEPLFMMNINNAKTITVETKDKNRIFDFEGADEGLKITERSTGFKPIVNNFRQFYKTLLSIHLQDYVSIDLTEAEVESLSNSAPDLTLTIETRKGKAVTYKFYCYSTRRAYYTVNGSGEFYVLRDTVEKVISDCEKVMNNETVDSEATT